MIGHDRLAGEVARDQRDVGLVHVQLDGVQELPPRRLGGVEVARDIEPDGRHPSVDRRDLGEQHVPVSTELRLTRRITT